MTAKTTRRWWTVLLLYPDWATDDFGADIFAEWALAATPEEAVPIVQRKAVAAQGDLSGAATVDLYAPDDFRMVAVIRGRHSLALDAACG